MDTVVGTIVILGIIVRVVLDLVSLFKRTATLDFVYGGLFAALALVAFVAEGPNVWAFACIGVGAFSFMAAVRKLQAKSKGQGAANGAP